MKKILLLFLLFSVESHVYSQVKILDTLSSAPIVGVNIYSDQGLLLGTSAINGKIDSLKEILATQVYIQHIAYENKELDFQRLKKSDTIYLRPRTIQLEEISVQNRNQYDYVVLKGYFRTHDLFNNKSRYFYDGIIEYYIPLNNKKKKVQHKLLSYRLFANQQSVDAYKELFGKTFTDPPKLFTVKNQPLTEKIKKKREKL